MSFLNLYLQKNYTEYLRETQENHREIYELILLTLKVGV